MKPSKIFFIISTATVVSLSLCTHAFALTLDEAKSKGLVGEAPSGYLEVITSTPEASQLVTSVNAERKNHYQSIAKKNNTPLTAVEELAGKKALEKTLKGNYIKLQGRWVKKS